MRHHNDPTKCPKPGRQLKPRRPPQPRQSPQPPQARGRCTRYVALHPLCGGAPVTWRCTRTEEVHCLRIGCSAPTNKNKRGTGAPNHSPPHPSMRSWALLVAGWARRPRHHLHSGPLRPNPTPPTPLNAKSRFMQEGIDGADSAFREIDDENKADIEASARYLESSQKEPT